jgi:hypothetical protein
MLKYLNSEDNEILSRHPSNALKQKPLAITLCIRTFEIELSITQKDKQKRNDQTT